MSKPKCDLCTSRDNLRREFISRGNKIHGHLLNENNEIVYRTFESDSLFSVEAEMLDFQMGLRNKDGSWSEKVTKNWKIEMEINE